MTAVGTPPSLCALVAGPCEVWVDTGASNAMEFLGWTANGVTIEERMFHGEIHDDTAGGDQGPPTDYQNFGGQHRIHLELQRYQDSVLAKVEARFNVAASSNGVGMLLGCVGGLFRVLLRGPNFVRNYESANSAGKGNCAVLDPIERSPIGSQASRARVTFTANHLAGVVPWDTVTTTP